MKNLICLICLALCLASCEKEMSTNAVVALEDTSMDDWNYEDFRDLSLANLVDHVDAGTARELESFQIEDLNDEVTQENRAAAKPKWLKWRWMDGCRKIIGICIIIGSTELDPDVNQASFQIEGDFLRITSLDGIHGFTKEGLLPVMSDLQLPQEIAGSFGRRNISLVPGLYQASRSSKNGDFDSVVVRIANAQ